MPPEPIRPPVPAVTALLVVAALALASVARAATDAPPATVPLRAPLVLDAHLRGELLDSLAAQVLRSYVEADTARLIVDRVRARQRAGSYDRATNPQAFAEAVTKDLRSINGDLHLSLRYDPDHSGPLAGSVVIRHIHGPGAGGPGMPVIREGPGAPGAGGGPIIVATGAPPGGGGPSDASRPAMPNAREQNFGLGRAEVLPGNVGYLEVTGFLEAPGMEDAMVAALRFLERTDAMIIDVRRNHGGSGNMSHLLFSHFLGPEPVPTIRVKSRIEGLSREQTSLADVPGPRRPEVPLYVLTSRGTGSAAEEFSFVLHNLRRATLIGERTAGAGHMVQGFDLPDGFVAGVSITRVSDPKSGREWEAIGVQPDVSVPSERALATAHADALRGLAARTDDPGRRRTLEMIIEWVTALDAHPPVAAAIASRIAGDYDGDRRVRAENGRLTFQRGPAPADELVPLGGERFSIGGEARITFGPGSPAASVSIERADGTVRTFPRLASGN